MNDFMNDFEIGTLIAALGLLVIYHLYLYILSVKHNNNQVQLSLNLQLAEQWVMKHKLRPDPVSGTLAIQTLRNIIVVAVLVGVVTLLLGVYTANQFNNYSTTQGRMRARTCILSACFIASFLCWANVIRYASHLGYLIGAVGINNDMYTHQQLPTTTNYTGIPPAEQFSSTESTYNGTNHINNTTTQMHAVPPVTSTTTTHQVVSSEFDKQLLVGVLNAKYLMTSFSFGFRFLFMAIPFIFFPMGAIGLIVATIILFMFMLSYDHGFMVGDMMTGKNTRR